MSDGAPLRGRTVLVTRGTGKGDHLGRLLESAGAVVIRVPLITTEPLRGAARLAVAIARLRSAPGDAWLVLTSETALTLLSREVGPDLSLQGVNVAVVGPATEMALRSRGIHAALVAPGQEAGSLAAALVARGVSGSRVLIVAAAGGRDVIAPALNAAGATVEVVESYRSVLPVGSAQQLRDALTAPIDAVTFTSGSTVAHFGLALAGRAAPGCPAICIGPVTAEAARRAGWATVVTAAEHTAAGVLAATVQQLRGPQLP